MEKTVDYPDQRFSVQEVRVALTGVGQLARDEDVEGRFERLFVELPEASWNHDGLEEFLADLVRCTGDASIVYEARKVVRVSVFIDRDGTRVSVSGASRTVIDEVFRLFPAPTSRQVSDSHPVVGAPTASGTRVRRLKERYARLRMSEMDLARVLDKVNQALAEFNSQATYTLYTADGEEVIERQDLEFLSESGSHLTLSRISVEGGGHRTPVRMELELPATGGELVKLDVWGTDLEKVSALFRDLDKELRDLSLAGASIVQRFDSFPVMIVGALTAPVAIYWIVVACIRLLDRLVGMPTLVEGLRDANSTLLLVFVFLGVPTAFLTIESLKRAFPSAEFTGGFKDPGRSARGQLKWVGGVLGIPIILDRLASIVWR